MFTHILLAVDETKESRDAVDAVVKLAVGGQSPPPVHVLHVLEHGRGWAAPYDLESSDDVNEMVAAVTSDLDAAGLQATSEVIEGKAGDVGLTIATTAAELGCDLVVVGSRGRSDLGAAILGSVAHDVIRHFDGCVLVTR